MAERKKTRKGHTPLTYDVPTLEEWKRGQEDPPAPEVHFVVPQRSVGVGDA